MIRKFNLSARTTCEHSDTVTVRNAGIERTICESCGKVSFTSKEALTGSADRQQFEREVERV